MPPEDYRSNAHRSKQVPEDEKNVEPVVTGEVIQKKRGFMQRFKSVFFGGDVRNAARYLGADVILPAIRNLMVDATTRGVERVVYGESAQQRRRPPTTFGSRISYNEPVRRPDRAYLPGQPSRPIGRQVRRDTNELILSSRDDAETVLERLLDIINKYDVASLADLYGLTGQPTSHIDSKWGWTDLRSTEIRQIHDGYLLDLPPVQEI